MFFNDASENEAVRHHGSKESSTLEPRHSLAAQDRPLAQQHLLVLSEKEKRILELFDRLEGLQYQLALAGADYTPGQLTVLPA